MFSVHCAQLFVPHLHVTMFVLIGMAAHNTRASYFICHDQETIKQLFENLRNYDGEE